MSSGDRESVNDGCVRTWCDPGWDTALLGLGIPLTPQCKAPQLWKENKAEQKEVRDPADSSHFTYEMHQNRGEGYGYIKKLESPS